MVVTLRAERISDLRAGPRDEMVSMSFCRISTRYAPVRYTFAAWPSTSFGNPYNPTLTFSPSHASFSLDVIPSSTSEIFRMSRDRRRSAFRSPIGGRDRRRFRFACKKLRDHET